MCLLTYHDSAVAVTTGKRPVVDGDRIQCRQQPARRNSRSTCGAADRHAPALPAELPLVVTERLAKRLRTPSPVSGAAYGADKLRLDAFGEHTLCSVTVDAPEEPDLDGERDAPSEGGTVGDRAPVAVVQTWASRRAPRTGGTSHSVVCLHHQRVNFFDPRFDALADGFQQRRQSRDDDNGTLAYSNQKRSIMRPGRSASQS